MMIDIPEQINCGYCVFCDYEQGICFLAEAKNSSEYGASIWANEGILDKEGEHRPNWCPFKAARNKTIEIGKCEKCGLCKN